MNLDDVYKDLKESSESTLEAMRKDLARLRTGRANMALLDGIKVSYYGTISPLNQVATLSIPEPRQILIQPWDQNAIGDIEKAIIASDLGLHPQNQGKIIRIILPELTEERRKDLAKLVKKRNEESKITIRHHRKESIDLLKMMEKDKDISEDELHKAQKNVQEIVDKYSVNSDEIADAKEKEIIEI
jgi:ribosome recycling factor